MTETVESRQRFINENIFQWPVKMLTTKRRNN
jgi:hypothetical protein